MSEAYYDDVLTAVKNNDRTTFDDICDQADIPKKKSIRDALWGAALGSVDMGAVDTAGVQSAGW